jgi:hypothetical protein
MNNAFSIEILRGLGLSTKLSLIRVYSFSSGSGYIIYKESLIEDFLIIDF